MPTDFIKFPNRRLLPLAAGAKVVINDSSGKYPAVLVPDPGCEIHAAWGTLIYNGEAFHVQTLLGVHVYPWPRDKEGTLEIKAEDFA